MPRALTLYTRRTCSLCDKMHAVVDRVRAQREVDLLVLDLDTEAPAEKRAAYDWEVPVLELDGRKVAKYRIEEERLLRLLDDG
jgi:glutaredoxin